MATFFTSDTHFGHKFVSGLRGYDDPAEMSDELVRRWNSVVQPNDTVWHLGDVVLGGFEKNKHYIGQLNGHKILVAGNHDRCFYGLKNFSDKDVKYREAGFDEVYFGQPMDIKMPGWGFVTLSHYPRESDGRHEDYQDRFLVPDDGGWLLHGHVHDLWRVRERQLNVGVDVWDGYPVSESEAIEAMKDPQRYEPYECWTRT